jgi:hypothetical protein
MLEFALGSFVILRGRMGADDFYRASVGVLFHY